MDLQRIFLQYNAKRLLGYNDLSLVNTMQQFVDCGALTMQPVLRGGFGGNPFSIGKVLDKEGVKHSTIDSFDDISDSGVYIVSFWNNSSFGSPIHTVTVEVKNSDTKLVYNNGDDDNVWSPETYSEYLFITGYKVSRK